MESIAFAFAANLIITSAFLGWLFAQMAKVIILAVRRNAWSFRYLWEQGGMPSSHAALVCALAFSILLLQGVSTSFVIALVFALVVIRDAVGVRQEVSKHAQVINKRIRDAKLSEHEGHTGAQVIVGSMLGLLAAAIVVRYEYTLYFIAQVLYLMLPAIAANGMPVLLARMHPEWNAPVDFGLTWLGRPLFGKNKTWRGIFGGTLACLLVILLQGFLFFFSPWQNLSLFNYPRYNLWLVGLAVAFGVLGGDLIGSFIKRRMRIAPGKSLVVVDQFDSLLGGLAVLLFFYNPTTAVVLTLIVSALVLHFLFNGIKNDLRWQ